LATILLRFASTRIWRHERRVIALRLLKQAGTMAGMQLADKALVHQVHPAKVGVDVTAAVVSNI
jgi:hypothetical protein